MSWVHEASIKERNPLPGLIRLSKRGVMTSGGLPVEGGYGWVVVCLLFLQFVIIAGIQGITGIIHTELVRETTYSLSVVGWIGSLLVGLATMSSPFISILMKFISCRILAITGSLLMSLGFLCAAFTSSVPVLFLFLGILPGIGMNLITFSSIMVLRGYFLKMLPLAYGTCLAGVGVGMVSFPPLYVYLHMTFGLKGSFLIVSAICLNSAVFSGLTIPTKAQSQKESKEEAVSLTDMFDFSLFKSHTFVMFVTGHLLFNIVYAVPFTYLPIKGEEAGFSEQSSALFITVLGAGSSISRILFGWMSGKFPLIRKKAFLVVVLTVTLSLLPVSFTRSYSIIMVCSTIFGACAGITHTEIPSFLIGLIGIDNLPNGLSVAYLQQGIGSLVGIPIAEAVCRRVGNNAAFVFTTLVSALVLVLFILSLYLPNRKPQKPRVQHIIPAVPKPEVFIVPVAETGPTAA